MLPPVYILDASSLINLFKNYSPDNRIHKAVWTLVEGLIRDKRLISCREVKREILNEEIKGFIHKNAQIFGVSNQQFDLVKEILEAYPEIDKPNATTAAHGDPFLIAVALENERKVRDSGWRKYIVVSEEKDKKSPTKIPYVSNQYGLTCLRLTEMLNEEGSRRGKR
jgi:hypothetical protein